MARGGAWIPTATRLLEICCKACLAGDRAGPGGSRVDRAAQVIKGVKVLATESRNGRRYGAGCLQRAARLYEGVSVRIDHPQKDDEDRRADDVLGQLRNVRVGPGGLYADLHYLKSHPMSARLCEAAEKMPKAFGLSHNVSDWEGHYEGGTYVVDEILEVESVDLVADPATTNGLFESHKKRRRGRRMKLQEWLAKKAPPATRKAVRRLVEAGAMAGSMLVEDGGDPEQAIKGAFRTAITAVLDDGAADMKAKMAKIKEILSAEEKLMASGAVTPPAADDVGMDAAGDDPGEPAGDELTEEGADAPFADDADDAAGDVEEAPLDYEDEGYEDDDDLTESSHEDGDEEEDEEVTESLRRENAALRRELDVRRLCESERAQATPVLVKALAALDTDQERRDLLRESRRSGRRAVAPAADSFADAITVQDED